MPLKPAYSGPWIISMVSYHALSLKEIGAVPGGAFRTFCDPVYRMSIPVSVEAWVDHHKLKYSQSCWLVVVWLFGRPCWSIRRGAPPIEATESTRKRQSYLHTRVTTRCSSKTQFMFVVWQCLVLRGPSYLWQSSPMPSSGWRTPVDDSPWARKNTAGLNLDKACGAK